VSNDTKASVVIASYTGKRFTAHAKITGEVGKRDALKICRSCTPTETYKSKVLNRVSKMVARNNYQNFLSMPSLLKSAFLN